MTIRAKYDNRYLWRYALIVFVGVGWALYCAYDLTFKYPVELEQAKVYHEQLKDLDERERQAQWDKICQENGWGQVRTSPRKPEKVEEVISLNYLQGIVALIIGLPPVFFILFSVGSWVEGDQQGIRTSWKQEFQFDDVKVLDKKKWEKKGIARAEYEQNGKRGIFVFDDFKYEREPIVQLLKNLEATLESDQIVGGQPEGESQAANANSSADETKAESAEGKAD